MSVKKKIVGIGLLALLSFAPILFASSGLAEECRKDACNGGDTFTNGWDRDAYRFTQRVGSYWDWGDKQKACTSSVMENRDACTLEKLILSSLPYLP